MVWYYADGNNQRGPVSDEEFDDLIARGRVRDETLVWQDGMSDWCSLEQAKLDGFINIEPDTAKFAGGMGETKVPPPSIVNSHLNQNDASYCANCGNNFSQVDLTRFANIALCSTCQPMVADAVRSKTGVALNSSSVDPVNRTSAITETGRILPRFVARLIDNFFISLLAVLTFFMFFDTSSLQAGVTPDMASAEMRPLLLMWVAFEAIYHAVFIGIMATTPGKMIFRLRVIQANGLRVSAPQSVVRAFSLALLQLASLLMGESTLSIVATLAQIACFATALYNPPRRTAFDFLANTRVIKV